MVMLTSRPINEARQAAISRRQINTPNLKPSTVEDVNPGDINAERLRVTRDLNAENQKASDAVKDQEYYKSKSITGPDQGFANSDFGFGERGAAIPYQVLESQVMKNPPPTVPAPPPLPPGPPKQPPGTTPPTGETKPPTGKPYSEYKVKRGDTLSEIADRFGLRTSDVWNYNLANRDPKIQALLRRQGKDLIFPDFTFFIPTLEEAIKRRAKQ